MLVSVCILDSIVNVHIRNRMSIDSEISSLDIIWVVDAGLVGLQAAVMDPQICEGIVLLNISLRMLHIKKQPWFGKPLIKSFQSLLR